MHETIEEMAEYITSHPNWDGCNKEDMLVYYSEEQIEEVYDMMMLDDEDDWR